MSEEKWNVGIFTAGPRSSVLFEHEGLIGDEMWRWIFRNDPELRDLQPSETSDTLTVTWSMD